MEKNLIFKSIEFDDFVVESDGSIWSQICDRCALSNEIEDKFLVSVGSGICGVKTCIREADLYIDWSISDVEIIDVQDK